MDPEIAKAARMYFDQMAKAKAAGDRPSATEREAYARQLTGGKAGYADMEALADKLHDDGGNHVASALQGFTSNFGDELVGLLPKFLGGGDNAKEEMRLRGDMQRREHPWADAAEQVAGGAASTLLLPASKAATVAEKALHGARIGAAYGAANGAGSGETLGDRALGGGAGLAGGAILGEAIPHAMATRAGQAVSRGVSAAVAPVANAVGRAFSAAPAADLSMLPSTAPVTEIVSPLERATASVQKAIDEMGGYGKAHEAVAAQRAAGRGDIVRMADLGRPLTKLADYAANNSSEAHNVLSDIVDARGAGATQRVIDDFKAAVGDAHAPTRQAELAAETKAWADGPDGYGTSSNGLGIRGANPQVTLDAAAPLVEQPKIRNMWDRAQATGQIGTNPDAPPVTSLASIATDPAMARFAQLNPGKSVEQLQATMKDPEVAKLMEALGKGDLRDAIVSGTTSKTHSFDNLFDLLHDLEDAKTHSFSIGKNNLAGRMGDAADVVRQTLETHVPGFADIQAKYAQRKGLETALQSGVDWFHSDDVTGLQKAVAALSPEELVQFRHGMASEQLIALNGKDGANAATKTMIAKNAPARTAKLKVVFGDEPTFDAFMEKAKAERQLGKLGTVVGGSQTHMRGAEAAALDGVVEHQLRKSSGSLQHRAIEAVQKAVVGPMRERRALSMLPQLTAEGADKLDALLTAWEAHQAQLGHIATHGAPAGTGSLFQNRSPE